MQKAHYTRIIPVWNEAPFLRFIPAFVAGLLLQWYLPLPFGILWAGSIICLAGLLLSFVKKTIPQSRPGLFIHTGLVLAACWVLQLNRQELWRNHIAQHYTEGQTLVANLLEPPVSKPKSYKANAAISIVDSSGRLKPLSGHIILYLAKSPKAAQLKYGSNIIFRKPLQSIRNAGNPGGFDYKRYAAFHGLYYQVYCADTDYVTDRNITINPFRQQLFATRAWVLQTFKKYIPNSREAAVAQALLIGYRDELDKSLVEQYASTGVVHIIAISGMHLGLIYGLLMILLRPLGKNLQSRIAKAILVIAALWLFSLLTGAAPSIIRSALMFSLVSVGQCVSKKPGSIYNALAVSAFILLLYDPFALWDVGFQLSYAAVLSIAVFSKPITAWCYTPYKWLNAVWNLIAVTLAAQILTLPLVIYHFHQLPVYFLLSNLIAVPLSSIILYGLLALLALSWWPAAATLLGKLLGLCIAGMNAFIGFISSLPYATIGGIYYTIPQSILLCFIIAAAAYWWLNKSRQAFVMTSVLVLSLLLLRTGSYIMRQSQQQLIVYNVPKLQAIDFIQGNHYYFLGDSSLQQKDFLQNFHLLPSRILHQASFGGNYALPQHGFHFLKAGKQKVLLFNHAVNIDASDTVTTDYLLISHNPATNPYQVLQKIHTRSIIMDASNSARRIRQWKIAADSLHLRLHSVQEQGAFVLHY